MKTSAIEVEKVENGYILEFEVETTEDCYQEKKFVFGTLEEVMAKAKEVMG